MLVGYFGRNLCALLVTDSNWRGWRHLVWLCWTVGRAGAGVWILNSTRWTMTIQDQRQLRLWSSLTFVMWFMLRSPLLIFFSLTSVLFSVGNCETGVSVERCLNFLTLNAGRRLNATCPYQIRGVWGAWIFVATAGQTTGGRGECWAKGLFILILMSFAVGEGFSSILCEFLLKFYLPPGLHHLHDALRGRRPQALGGTCITMTFSVGVLLAGSDPVPQLPINMFCCWTGALLNKHHIKIKKKQTKKKTVVTTLCIKYTSAFIELLPGHFGGSSAALSPSESDLELLSESLEQVDSSPLECGALNELQNQTQTSKSKSHYFDLQAMWFSGFHLPWRALVDVLGGTCRWRVTLFWNDG